MLQQLDELKAKCQDGSSQNANELTPQQFEVLENIAKEDYANPDETKTEANLQELVATEQHSEQISDDLIKRTLTPKAFNKKITDKVNDNSSVKNNTE